MAAGAMWARFAACNTPSRALSLLQVLGLPGVAGLHVMPLTKSARRMALDFLADGTLPSHAH